MKLPGVGQKTASRYLLYILKAGPSYAKALADMLSEVSSSLVMCSLCRDFTTVDPCEICRGENRNRRRLCIVESPRDVEVVESTGVFDGIFFVLHGLLDPSKSSGPDELGIPHLVSMIESDPPEEVIIALDYTFLGDTTADYIARTIKKVAPDSVITRPSIGVPVGGDMEYLDSSTLKMAFTNRSPLGTFELD